MMCCLLCTHWEEHADVYGRHWHECNKPEWLDKGDSFSLNGFAMYAEAADDSGLHCGVMTGPNFVCYQFEKRVVESVVEDYKDACNCQIVDQLRLDNSIVEQQMLDSIAKSNIQIKRLIDELNNIKMAINGVCCMGKICKSVLRGSETRLTKLCLRLRTRFTNRNYGGYRMSENTGIPEGWTYKRLLREFWHKLPVAWIKEGTSSLQCLCPNCSYGNGYNEPFLSSHFTEVIRVCPTCKTKFIALVTG